MSRRESIKLRGTLDVDLAHLPFESALDLSTSRSWLEIDLDAIAANIKSIREALGERVKILLPVKADGYGHGAVEVVREAIRNGVTWFGVASLEEALVLRRRGVDGEILLLTPPLGVELEVLVIESITPVIADLHVASRLNEYAGRRGTRFPVHVEVDTGMGRTGVSWRLALAFIRDVASLENLEVEGIFSHFSSADEEDPSFTDLQLQRFLGLMEVVRAENLSPALTHVSNSAAALRLTGTELPMIRPGLFVYGVSPLPPLADSVSSTSVPAMSFRSRIVQVKAVERGEPIGYARTFIAPGRMAIGTVAVGYRDGLDYGLSNRGEVLIRGRRCPIVGSICMDMMMVDVSSLECVSPGDRVTILGEDEGERIGAGEIASVTGTIPYDVMTKLGNKVPRVYFRGGLPVKITSVLGNWVQSGKERDPND